LSDARWEAVDRSFDALVAPDPALDAALAACDAAGLPPHAVAPNQGKLLQLLARAVRARRILEVGTLGGISAIWMARALPPNGQLVTLEADARHAAVARANVARAGLEGIVEVRVGPALDSLARLVAEAGPPFDLIFLDADKPNNPQYLAWSLRLARRGTLLVADNVVRGGAVAAADDDPSAAGVRRFLALLAAEPRVSATAIQTVGSKGWDGFAIALVTADASA
jgi:predicted O-methyltransferase YrrM